MRIRLAQLADIAAISGVNALALCDDELIAALAPRRHEYWEEFVNFYIRRNKDRFYTPGYALWVAVTDEGDGEEKIVGYAVWRRDGKGEDAKRWGEWVGGEKGGWLWKGWCAFQKSLVTMSDRIVDSVDLNPSVNREAVQEFDAVAGNSFPPSAFPEIWYLALLAVHPSYQRRGIGQMLLQWGIDQASAEHVPIGLESSPKGLKLYKDAGFRTLKWVEWMGRDSPAMVWKPQGAAGQRAEES